MDKTTKRRVAELETRVGNETPVVNLRVVYVDPRVEDDDKTLEERQERTK